jgi:signal transduction histidine kinase
MSTHPLRYSDYNILIVDDMPVNLSIVVDYLEEYGFGIRIARNGESALQRARYDPPDLILLDVLMPGINGFETCRRLKADAATRDIPVIFMTALTNPEDKVRGFEVGAVDYVTKPLGQEEVLARITTHLRLRELTRSLQEQTRQLEARNQVERVRLLEAVGQQRKQLRALTRKLTEVQETERKQLARELHDELGQMLTAVGMNLAALQKELAATASPAAHQRLAETSQLVDQTLEQIRELSLNLRPPMLDDLGLIPTVRWYVKRYAERSNLTVQCELTEFDTRLDPEIETALYRILQEALTNIARHAQATLVHLRVDQTPTEVTAYVEDNGVGFDVASVMEHESYPGGAGLLGMRERVTLLAGTLTIASEPGGGTQLYLTIPREETP